MIHPLHPFNIRSFCYASSLKFSPIIPSELSSSSIRFHSPSFLYSSVLPPCYILPLSVLFHFVFANFPQFCRYLKRMKRSTPKFGRLLCPFCICFVFIDQWALKTPNVEHAYGFVKPKKQRYKQMEIFHQCFRYTPSNLSDFIECSFLLQSVYIFCR